MALSLLLFDLQQFDISCKNVFVQDTLSYLSKFKLSGGMSLPLLRPKIPN